MSETQSETSVCKALDTEAIASDWIERRDFGPWSENDQVALEQWIAQSLAHRIAFVRLDSGWKKAARLKVLSKPMQNVSAATPASHTAPKVFRLAAAAVVLAAAVGATAYLTMQPAKSTYATNIGEREVLSLADGSEIELNTDTVVRTAVSHDSRIVWLDKGEAYFHVKHDLRHPFVVFVGDRRITDIGTEFAVRKDVGRLSVSVVEGSVQLDNLSEKHAARPRILRKGDVVVATANSTSVSNATPRELAGELGWRRGVLIFDRTPLSEAAQEINRYNRKKLVIADPAAGRLRIGGTFPKNNVDAITAAARELFGLHVEDHGDEIVVSRQ